MLATPEALWATPPLTTDAAMIERSVQAGNLTLLMRADRPTWANLSSEQQGATVHRLQFARWHLNRHDRLGRRVVLEGQPMRRPRAEIEGTAVAVLAFVGLLCHRAARWLCRRGR